MQMRRTRRAVDVFHSMLEGRSAFGEAEAVCQLLLTRVTQPRAFLVYADCFEGMKLIRYLAEGKVIVMETHIWYLSSLR